MYVCIYIYIHIAFGIATPSGALRRAAAKGLQPRAAARHRFTTKDFFRCFNYFLDYGAVTRPARPIATDAELARLDIIREFCNLTKNTKHRISLGFRTKISCFFAGNATFLGTGFRRLIGSPKLQIIFHKKTTKYRSLLRKMTYKDKGSYESSPSCNTRLLVSIEAGHLAFARNLNPKP